MQCRLDHIETDMKGNLSSFRQEISHMSENVETRMKSNLSSFRQELSDMSENVSQQLDDAKIELEHVHKILPPPGFHGPFIPFMGNVGQTHEKLPQTPVQHPTSVYPCQTGGIAEQIGNVSVLTDGNANDLRLTQPDQPVQKSFEQAVLDAVRQISSQKSQTTKASAEKAAIDKLTSAIPADNIYSGRKEKTEKVMAPKEKPPEDKIINPKQKPPEKERGRSKRKKSADSSSDEGSDRSRSPLPPKLQVFSGDPKGPSWSGFISRFDRVVKRRNWSKKKRLERLFDCLSEKALEYANRADGRKSYSKLKKELTLRFDIKDAPVAARQKLHLIKQTDEETLEEYLQRVLTTSMDGFSDADNDTIQQLATEAFLRGL